MEENRYNQLIQQLYEVNQLGGMKMGLANILRLNRGMGAPDRDFKSVQIAGTNGKGSVALKMAEALQHAGYRVGLYTSPHISSFRERIRVNREMIPESAVVDLLPPIFKMAAERSLHPTFFEFTTELAFCYFSQEKVDFALLETGLGGRLDATNIVDPEICVITSITMEHTDILGDSIELIAREKGGIIKPLVPVVSSSRVPLEVLRNIAFQQESPFYSLEQSSFETTDEENSLLAAKALELLGIDSASIQYGIARRPPCRLEKRTVSEGLPRPVEVILDVAHNPDGLDRLFSTLSKMASDQTIYLVFGLSKTKNLEECLDPICRSVSRIYLVETSNGQGYSTELIREALSKQRKNSLSFSEIQLGVRQALHDAAESEKGMVVICGSFYIMGEARKALGINEPVDAICLNSYRSHG